MLTRMMTAQDIYLICRAFGLNPVQALYRTMRFVLIGNTGKYPINYKLPAERAER
jgi:hypothetical protein